MLKINTVMKRSSVYTESMFLFHDYACLSEKMYIGSHLHVAPEGDDATLLTLYPFPLSHSTPPPLSHSRAHLLPAKTCPEKTLNLPCSVQSRGLFVTVVS